MFTKYLYFHNGTMQPRRTRKIPQNMKCLLQLSEVTKGSKLILKGKVQLLANKLVLLMILLIIDVVINAFVNVSC